MRPALLFLLLLAACTPPEPPVECITHSVAATGGGLVECTARPEARP